MAQEFSATRKIPWKDFELFKPFLEEDSCVLDLGCGNGRLSLFLRKLQIKSYTGLDYAPLLLDEAKRAFPDEKFVLADMTSPLPFNKKFDAIFAVASFHHVPPVAQLATLREWRKHLKPGGYLMMTNWNLHTPRFWIKWVKMLICPSYGFKGLLIPWRNEIDRYYFAFSKHRLNRLLKKSGFEVCFNSYVYKGIKSNIFSGSNVVTVAKI